MVNSNERDNDNVATADQPNNDSLIKSYTAFTSITGTLLVISSLLSLDALVSAHDLKKLHLPVSDDTKKIHKFTIANAVLFGTELLGGLLWRKAQEKKAHNFNNRLEQEKRKTSEISASR